MIPNNNKRRINIQSTYDIPQPKINKLVRFFLEEECKKELKTTKLVLNGSKSSSHIFLRTHVHVNLNEREKKDLFYTQKYHSICIPKKKSVCFKKN